MIWATSPPQPRPGAADLLWQLLGPPFGGELPLRLRAWDGSEVGPPDRPTLVVRDRKALRRLLWQPGELGLARAYVAGELDVDGDLTECLRLGGPAPRDRNLTGARLSPGGRVAAARAAVRLGIVCMPPAPPASEARISGRPRSRKTDQETVSSRDVPHGFYQLILGPQLAYSAALWAPGCRTLADAQLAKLDMICAKLRLVPGKRLLDVGCGWGTLAIHAARNYGVQVTAVAPAGQQAAVVQRRVAKLGLQSLVTVQVGHYRDVTGPPHDGVAAVEMAEHVSDADYPAFCDLLRSQLGPGGRLLIQQLSRGSLDPGGGAFVERYIAPDMRTRTVGETISLLERAGFEISDLRAMRPDCTKTIRAWQQNLERRWDEAVGILGVESARAWRLYLAGSALAFEEGRMGVHQILAAPQRSALAASRRPDTHTASARLASVKPADARSAGAQSGRVQWAGQAS